MNEQCIPPEYSFRVEVNINFAVPTYTFYNSHGQPLSDHEAIVISKPNTAIIFTLTGNTENLIFAAPIITADYQSDLTILISNEQQSVTIYDNDLNNESVCVKLVTVRASEPTRSYISRDPRMINRPS